VGGSRILPNSGQEERNPREEQKVVRGMSTRVRKRRLQRERLNALIEFSATPTQSAQIDEAATAAGIPRSEWLREAAAEKIARLSKKNGREGSSQ
jgi:transcriptional regulator NrdR family protein